LGAISSAPFSEECHLEARWLLRVAMALATVSLAACAWPLGFAWFFFWRTISGVAGGMAMVLAAPTILPHIPPAHHGVVSGAVFVGVGAGIALSGTLVPLLLQIGLTQTWLGLALLSAIMTLVGWRGWPSGGARTSPRHVHAADWPAARLRTLYFSFLVAFVAGLGETVDAGSQYWVLYGLGAIAGPLLAGRLADQLGFRDALTLVFVVQLLAVGLLVIDSSTAALIASSIAGGACTIGVVPLVLGRTRELLRHHPAAMVGAWRTATVSFAVLQAGSAYAMSFVLEHSGSNFRLLFAMAAGAMGAALLLDRATGESG
jgi:predicted MFS family arabinose efflux permease